MKFSKFEIDVMRDGVRSTLYYLDCDITASKRSGAGVKTKRALRKKLKALFVKLGGKKLWWEVD